MNTSVAIYKTFRFANSQIRATFTQHENSVAVADFAHENGFRKLVIYQLTTNFGGIDATNTRRMKKLEAKHARL